MSESVVGVSGAGDQTPNQDSELPPEALESNPVSLEPLAAEPVLPTVEPAMLSLEVDIRPRVNYAMSHNRAAGIPPIRSIDIRNISSVPGRALTVSVTSRWAAADVPPLKGEPVVITCPPLGATESVSTVGFRLDDVAMVGLEEAAPAEVTVTVTDDDARSVSQTFEVTMLARNQWNSDVPIIIAAFVQPNHPSVNEILAEASTILLAKTSSGSLQGYQSGPDRVGEIAEAVFLAMKKRVPTYIDPPAGFEEEGQKLRPIDQVLEEGQGTCIDLACAYASVMQQAGINTVIALVHGHAFPMYFTAEHVELPEDVVTGVSTILGFVDSKLLVPVESVEIPGPGTFEAAVLAGRQHLSDRPHICSRCADAVAAGMPSDIYPHLKAAVDIRRAYQRRGIRPIPARVKRGDVIEIVIDNGPGSPPVTERRDATTNKILPKTVPARVQSWKNSLLDLSLRNRLLNFDPAKQGIQLVPSAGRLGDIEDHLIDGGRVEVADWRKLGALEAEQGYRNLVNFYGKSIDDRWSGERLVYGFTGDAELPDRAKKLMSTAKAEFEDTSVNNLNLTLGSIFISRGGAQRKEGLLPRDLYAPVFLLPVVMRWNRGRTGPTIEADPGGITTPNYCLLEWLRAKFKVELAWFRGDMSDASGLDVQKGLDELRRELMEAGKSDQIQVVDDAAVGVLKFDKIRLWKDLDEHWESFSKAPVVGHLVEGGAGAFKDPADPNSEGTPAFTDATLLNPQPADGAQTQAIVRALAGHSFVLEGPPGTGKSQTITNLLSNALASGKKVLFVAQKAAALDEVHKRLAKVGLDPFCLDLHDKSKSMDKVKEQLRDAIDFVPTVSMERWDKLEAAFEVACAALETYRARLHGPTEAGTSYFDAYEQLAKLGDGPVASIGRALARVDGETVKQVRQLLLELPAVSDPAQPTPQHPWRFAGARRFADIDRTVLAEAIGRVSSALVSVQQAEGAWADAVAQCPDLASFEGVMAALTLLERRAVLPADGEWRYIAASEWHTAVDERLAHIEASLGHLDTTAPGMPVSMLARDISPQVAAFNAVGSGFLGMGRKAKLAAALGDIASFVQLDDKDSAARTLQYLASLGESYRLAVAALRSEPGMSALVPQDGVIDQGGLVRIREHADLLTGVAKSITSGQAHGESLRLALQGMALPPSGANVSLSALAEGLRDVNRIVSADADGLAAWAQGRGLIAAIQASLQDWRDGTDGLSFVKLNRWCALLDHLEPLTVAPFMDFRSQILNAEIRGEDADDAFDRALMNSVLTVVGEEHQFDVFDWNAQDRNVQRFIGLLRERQEMLREVIPAILHSRRDFDPKASIGAVGQLRVELNSKRRGARSVRELVRRYPDLISQLTPCFMMSPDSVAKFLEPDKVAFDLVVFDEASQITVPDAVGAMGRGKSTVIVGDSRQMPPTSMFAATAAGASDDDFEYGDLEAVPEDADSILEECVESGLPREWLSWHYRSQDELLISFSNQHYYEGRLASFPAADLARAGCGVAYHRVDGQFGHRTTKENPVEADAIVAEVVRRVHDPVLSKFSMGIVTLNIPQQRLVRDNLIALGDPLITELLDSDDGDRNLFVLNLESVQGRERDVIILGTAFSRKANGDKFPLNFGPLTMVRGERRLNVAITRARRQVVIFSSFDPEELTDAKSLGVAHLRDYLILAREASRDRAGLSVAGTRVEPDFHTSEVADALRARGLVVKENLGMSSFKVDIAVSTPEHPDRWLVAVLLDGRSWGDRRLALDRDALPVTVLQSLMGWPVIARVWLPTWRREREEIVSHLHDLAFRAAVGEFDTLTPEEDELIVAEAPSAGIAATSGDVVTSIESDVLSPSAAPAVAPSEPHVPVTQPSAAAGRVRPYVSWEMPGIVGAAEQLSSAHLEIRGYLRQAAEAEGPLPVDLALRKVARGFGLQTVRQNRIDEMRPALDRSLVVDTPFGQWLFPPSVAVPGGVSPDYNWYRTSTSNERKITEIAPQEIANALVDLTHQSHRIARADLASAVLATFGYARKSAEAQAHAEAVIDWAVGAGYLVEEGGVLRAPTS
jgi:hypothetical protein